MKFVTFMKISISDKYFVSNKFASEGAGMTKCTVQKVPHRVLCENSWDTWLSGLRESGVLFARKHFSEHLGHFEPGCQKHAARNLQGTFRTGPWALL